jgi:hypothetical protein
MTTKTTGLHKAESASCGLTMLVLTLIMCKERAFSNLTRSKALIH